MRSAGRLHLVDADPTTRQSMARVLETSGLEVRLYGAAHEFLASPIPALSDAVVADLGRDEISGVDLVRRLREEGRPLPVVLIAGPGEVAGAVAAVKAGAHDVIDKPVEAAQLLAAAASARQAGLAQSAADVIRLDAVRRLAALTARERDVFKGVVEGLSNKEIARLLAISPRTVETYRTHVMIKTAAGSLPDLVRISLLATG